MKPSTPETREARDHLTALFKDAPDGAEITWGDIAKGSGIRMDVRGKELVRHVLRKLHRPYESIRGQGLRLSCANTALTIVRDRFVRIDNRVREADRTQRDLTARHLHQMDEGGKSRLLMVASFFGAIRTIADNARTQMLTAKASGGRS